jgi:hypothetical protein
MDDDLSRTNRHVKIAMDRRFVMGYAVSDYFLPECVELRIATFAWARKIAAAI